MSNGDPAVLEKRGKSNAARKGRYDGAYTGTEQRVKNELMRQFMKNGEGPGGNSDAYRDAPCWCACGRLIVRNGLCQKCENAALEDGTYYAKLHARCDAELERVRTEVREAQWAKMGEAETDSAAERADSRHEVADAD